MFGDGLQSGHEMSFRGAGVLLGLLGLAELYYRRIAESGVV